MFRLICMKHKCELVPEDWSQLVQEFQNTAFVGNIPALSRDETGYYSWDLSEWGCPELARLGQIVDEQLGGSVEWWDKNSCNDRWYVVDEVGSPVYCWPEQPDGEGWESSWQHEDNVAFRTINLFEKWNANLGINPKSRTLADV